MTDSSAKMVGNGGTLDIHVLRSGTRLIFIEMTQTVAHTYVVYDVKTKGLVNTDFLTIQSRNGLIGGITRISS